MTIFAAFMATTSQAQEFYWPAQSNCRSTYSTVTMPSNTSIYSDIPGQVVSQPIISSGNYNCNLSTTTYTTPGYSSGYVQPTVVSVLPNNSLPMNSVASGTVVTNVSHSPISSTASTMPGSTQAITSPSLVNGINQVQVTQPIGTLTSSSRMPVTNTAVYTNTYPSTPTSFNAQPISTGASAQYKAQQAALMQMKGHVGGGMCAGARYEGVGWSTLSAQDAIQRCCYWGTRPVAQIGTYRGTDGWYACVMYY